MRRRRRGAALVEFALLALPLYLLLAAILTFGFLLYSSQGLEQASTLAARELARSELPAEMTLEDALYGNANADPDLSVVRKRVFDEHYLVLNLDTLHGEATFSALVAKLPNVNRQMIPLMIADSIGGSSVLRYPGAVFLDGDAADDPADPPPSGWLVRIPWIVARDPGDGRITTIRWVRVFEEVEPDDPLDPAHDPFRLTSTERGLVSLRVNYPFQSAAMSSFQPNPAGEFEPTIGSPIAADDGAVGVENPAAAPGVSVESDRSYGPQTGEFGLGRQAAFGGMLAPGQDVRPYSRLLSIEAVQRRELFGP
ncbi:MAG TPA: TadE/TadG family type IV pilus assembly protein [Pirellulaceae bacterium]|nr:TadE/TadG family type IV pilus assembly protein [Pirellulaceae bacterium]